MSGFSDLSRKHLVRNQFLKVDHRYTCRTLFCKLWICGFEDCHFPTNC